MSALLETPHGRNQHDLVAAHAVPDSLLLLDKEERAALERWARGEAGSRSRDAMLKEAQSVGLGIERAERLCQRLLQEGWISRREELKGGNWLWKTIAWRDLRRLQGLLGIIHAEQRKQARQAMLEQARQWLLERGNVQQTLLDPDLLDELTLALKALEEDKSLRADVLEARLGLLRALAAWHDSGQQGLRRNFALQARDLTKSLSASEWRWLEALFDLERLNIASFAQVGWLSGDLVFSWQGRRLELAPLHCVGLPLDDLLVADALTAPRQWWLIENRTSFELQARQRPAGVALLWMPGRPSPAWLATVSHLLQLAPAPAWISADADPAGVDIACTVGSRWEQAGLTWEPYQMGLAQWQSTTQRWPLNAHDRRLLGVLLARPSLPASLRALCEAMQTEGRKAEQEAWL
ncbi:MAG TPA: DUF2399 domain-containing protein [Herbaspirillum sp.]|uniref:DUF2399 domain-containing protein n=2 Tax=Herbaspirillum sp. TaxID=1890675 RepID=UPI002D6D863B|nr:DUF2399 domain-containing protein [Herbaspirillum sp.]HZG20961.1 DUF2399 domain-containing protein [Herbaspirillum sp.]